MVRGPVVAFCSRQPLISMNILRKQKKGAEDSNKANNSIMLQQPRYFLSGNFLFLFRKKWAGREGYFSSGDSYCFVTIHVCCHIPSAFPKTQPKSAFRAGEYYGEAGNQSRPAVNFTFRFPEINDCVHGVLIFCAKSDNLAPAPTPNIPFSS